jgi:hypothetical protein
MTPDSPVPSDTKTCAKCGRTGTRQFSPEGDTWVCASEWSCRGRVAEANAKPPSQATCHKCGRVGVRDFLFDAKAQAPKCSNWAACSDRQREAGFKETAEDLNTADSVQVDVNAVPSDTDRLAEADAIANVPDEVADIAIKLLEQVVSGHLDAALESVERGDGAFEDYSPHPISIESDARAIVAAVTPILLAQLQGRLDTAEGQLAKAADPVSGPVQLAIHRATCDESLTHCSEYRGRCVRAAEAAAWALGLGEGDGR